MLKDDNDKIMSLGYFSIDDGNNSDSGNLDYLLNDGDDYNVIMDLASGVSSNTIQSGLHSKN